MSRPPRVKGFSYLGPYRYFVTFCTRNRQQTFLDVHAGESVVLEIRRTCRQLQFALLAYCVMPDHVHLLVEGTSDASDLKRLIKTMKQRTGQRFAARHRHPLWQEGFYDRVLRENDDPKQIAQYIINNPVRAGLVRSATDYALVGSGRWTTTELIDSLW